MKNDKHITPIANMLPDYAELFCLSNFTFLQGASHAEELVKRAVALSYTALAITDECSLAGIVRAHEQAKKAQLPLMIGSFFKLIARDDESAPTLIAIAQNRNGYGNLCELITLARMRSQKGEYLLTCEDFTRPPDSLAHLKHLPDCLLILVPDYPAQTATLTRQVAWLKQTFSERAWAGLNLLLHPFDDAHTHVIEQVARQNEVPIVAIGHVCMHVRSRKPLQDTLTAIRLNTAVPDCGYALAPNAEQHLRSRLRLANIYPAQALVETLNIAKHCTFSLDELRYEYPEEVIPPGFTPARFLRQEVMRGAAQRFPHGISSAIQKRIEHELHLINDLAYEAYFLTVYDIVQFARARDILCQGRGSAANSVVCYCLHITEVNPERSAMLFERFISKERNEPPDIDVDFEHQRREEVIQYIYQKYGKDRAALAAAVNTFRSKASLREVGKALGIDPAIVDAVSTSQHWFDRKQDLSDRFIENGLDPDTPMAQRWAELALQLRGFPRHLSQHTGGFVIARGKLSRLVPIENATMKDRRVIQWDKDDLEALGLMKVDVLALGMLSALKRALILMSPDPNQPMRLQDIPREDAATYDMICAADTVGVFQIESRAQMSMLPRLRPRVFYDLVVQVAIVRPGPIQGGMVHPYLKRRQSVEAVTYPSDEIKQALSRTLGVPIFQEQVMQVAILAAQFTPGEADQLRRAMAAWKRKGGLNHYHERIVGTMIRRGYEPQFANDVFQQMLGFGEYGFPESHATSFALLTYFSSWIKRHEPAVFLCALLNSQPMGFYSPSQLVQDARKHGIKVLPVDIATSDWESSLETNHDLNGDLNHYTNTIQSAVRLGLSRLSGMNEAAAKRIEHARVEHAFTDATDLARRAQLDRQDMQALAAGNALASLCGHRHQALWHAVAALPDKDLLRSTTVTESAPALRTPSEAQTIVSDYQSTGLTLNRHPLALLRKRLLEKRFLPADMLNTFQPNQFARGCGIVTVRQRPGTAKGVLFVTIEDETGTVNVIIWPALLEKQRREALNATLLGVYGIWQTQDGVRHLVAKRLVDLSVMLGELQTGSRDFH